MYPKTRDLEIVYNLLWKSKPHQSDDRANIVGMYDIPSTTLKWETFKSYLLKNSGSNASDIKVSYIDSDDKEISINSQNDFQLALYSFRRRARIGEIITLKIDKLNTRKLITQLIQSTDAEIQTHEYKDEATQPGDLFDEENPPKWFMKHMKKFEKKITDDMKQQFTLFGSKVQSSTCQHSHPSRSKATKPETYKRPRKFDLTKVNMDKDLCKQYKFEKKLESKLEKLEHKTTKLKAKKLAAMKVSSDSDAGRGPNTKFYQPINEFCTDVAPAINSVALNTSSDKTAGPLYTNSVYLQKWEVTNCGQSAWDDRTELRYAWGSEKLRPTFTILKCPELQPGEKGEITVWFQIPSTPGSYECFWHFYDCGRRFGHWIGCQLTVVDYPRRTQSSIPTVSSLIDTPVKLDTIDLTQSIEPVTDELNKHMEELALADAGVNNLNYTPNFELSSDSDNISIQSGTNSPRSASSDYVVIPSPDSTNVVEKRENEGVFESTSHVEIDELSQLPVSTNDIGNADSVSVASEANADERDLQIAENENSDYAFIYYNGEKYPFHKEFLRPEYFTEAEKCIEAPECSSSKQSDEHLSRRTRQFSSSSQDSAKRLFVFPRHSPGFEVVYPAEEAQMGMKSASSYEDGDEYYSIKDGFAFPPQSQSNYYFHPLQSPVQSNHEQLVSIQSGSSSFTPSQPLNASFTLENVLTASSSTHDFTASQKPQVPASPTYGETRVTTSTTYSSPQMSESEQPKFNGRVHRPNSGKKENIITEAAILASSAMSTARNVVNMVINTGNGKWVNGHWVADSEKSKRENGLKLLAEMGFMNRDLNATLLARYNDDVHRVISELVQ